MSDTFLEYITYQLLLQSLKDKPAKSATLNADINLVKLKIDNMEENLLNILKK